MVKKKRKYTKRKKKAGAKSGYKPAWDMVAYNMCVGGALDKELCIAFGVTRKTLQRWKKKFPSFGKSIWDGKDSFDGE